MGFMARQSSIEETTKRGWLDGVLWPMQKSYEAFLTRDGPVLFLHLFHGTNSSAKISELGSCWIVGLHRPQNPVSNNGLSKSSTSAENRTGWKKLKRA